MKIKFTRDNWDKGRVEDSDSVEGYITDALRAADEGNELDRAAQSAHLTKMALGRLVEIMAEKGILGIADVLSIAEYRPNKGEDDHQLDS